MFYLLLARNYQQQQDRHWKRSEFRSQISGGNSNFSQVKRFYYSNLSHDPWNDQIFRKYERKVPRAKTILWLVRNRSRVNLPPVICSPIYSSNQYWFWGNLRRISYSVRKLYVDLLHFENIVDCLNIVDIISP